MTDAEHEGVWISDRPLDGSDMGTVIEDPVVFEVQLEESQVADYEWVEDCKDYREWLVPAAILNTFPRRVVEWSDVMSDEVQEEPRERTPR